MNNKPLLLDCTIRDGGYNNLWRFKPEDITRLYDALNLAKYDYMEVGFRNDYDLYKNEVCGPWRYTSEELIRECIPNIKHTKLAVMVDYKHEHTSQLPDKNETIVEMIRVAFHKYDMNNALIFCSGLKKKGYTVCANAMATFNYDDDELKELVEKTIDNEIDYLYIADSYGCLLPIDIETICNKVKQYINGHELKLGIHLHNNLQNGIANAIESIKCGIDIVDSTVLGLGRGAGNLPTELLIITLNKYCKYTGKLLPILHVAQSNILQYYPLYDIEKLFHIIGAYYQCHPNYICQLIDYKINNVIDIWKIICKLVSIENHKYFDKEILKKLINDIN